jgi:hypothetical protein
MALAEAVSSEATMAERGLGESRAVISSQRSYELRRSTDNEEYVCRRFFGCVGKVRLQKVIRVLWDKERSKSSRTTMARMSRVLDMTTGTMAGQHFPFLL